MAKKIVSLLVLFILTSTLLVSNVINASAHSLTDQSESKRLQAPTGGPLPNINSFGGKATFSFAQLGQPTFELRYPFGKRFEFTLPYRWALTSDPESNFIELHYDMYYFDNYQNSDTGFSEGDRLPVFEVYVDGVFTIAMLPLPGKNQTLRVPIPLEVVAAQGSNTHFIRLDYVRGQDCEDDEDAMIVIHSDSTIQLSFQVNPPELNLADFPHPLIQDSFIPESVLFIIPDNYSEADLAAAAIVSAALGEKAVSVVYPEVVTASQVTAEQLTLSNAIIIGLPDQNAFLNRLYSLGLLPTRLSSDGKQILGTAAQAIEPQDGVVQLMYSEISTNNTYLIVTSGTEEGLLHAAQSLASANPAFGLNNQLAVIKNLVEIPQQSANSVEVFTFEELGMFETVFYGIGSQSTGFSFYIPANWELNKGAALVIDYAHSSQLNSGSSIVTVELNRNPIGSLPIQRNATGETQIIIPINPNDLIPGRNNYLSFEISMDIDLICSEYDSNIVWIRIRDTSRVQLPHTIQDPNQDHLTFADPFFYLLFDSNVLLSLPPQPTLAQVNALVRFAQTYGIIAPKRTYNFTVTTSAEPDAELLAGNNVVLFGRPTENPLIAQVNDILPQPFVAGTDELAQQIGDITYRLPASFSTGIVQVAPSPWASGRGVTVVSGTTNEGVTWAMNAFADDDLVYELSGDVSFIQDQRIEAIKSDVTTRAALEMIVATLASFEIGAEIVETPEPEETPVLSAVLPEKYAPVDDSLPSVVSIVMLVLIGAGILTAVFGGMLSMTKNRKQNKGAKK